VGAKIGIGWFSISHHYIGKGAKKSYVGFDLSKSDLERHFTVCGQSETRLYCDKMYEVRITLSLLHSSLRPRGLRCFYERVKFSTEFEGIHQTKFSLTSEN